MQLTSIKIESLPGLNKIETLASETGTGVMVMVTITKTMSLSRRKTMDIEIGRSTTFVDSATISSLTTALSSGYTSLGEIEREPGVKMVMRGIELGNAGVLYHSYTEVEKQPEVPRTVAAQDLKFIPKASIQSGNLDGGTVAGKPRRFSHSGGTVTLDGTEQSLNYFTISNSSPNDHMLVTFSASIQTTVTGTLTAEIRIKRGAITSDRLEMTVEGLLIPPATTINQRQNISRTWSISPTTGFGDSFISVTAERTGGSGGTVYDPDMAILVW